MGWSREFIERVREATDLTDVARDYGETKNAGPGKVKMNCPLPNHSEKTPSCHIQREFFKCFGCGEGGDAFKFIELVENHDFNETVDHLARRAGIGSSYPNPPDWTGRSGGGDDGRKDLFYALSQAAEILHLRLLDMQNKPAQQARKFLKSRRIGSEQAKKYMVGYSYPRVKGHADGLIRDLKPRMASYFENELDKSDSEFDNWFEKTLIEAGLAKEYEGQLSDFFFDERIMFTIFDASDRPIAFSGRQLPDGRDPKYRNSPNSKIYAKDETLYGLNWARKNLANENSALVSEGCLDVIALHECGLPTAVAPCGTSMTEKQVKKLAKYTKNFSLCFDSDSAGQKATERFTQWEEEDDLNLTVVELPAGQDPGDFHANGRCDALTKLTESTTRFLRWRIDRIWALADPNDIEGRSMTAETMLQIVKDHHNEMIHDDYIRQIAEITELSYSHLIEKFKGIEKTPKRKAPMPAPQEPPDDDYRRVFDQPPPDLERDSRRVEKKPKTRQSSENLDSAECRALSLMLHNRQKLEDLNIWPERLSEEFFYEGIHRQVFNALNTSTTYDEAQSHLGEDLDLIEIASDYGETKNAGPGKVKMCCPLPNHSEETPSCHIQREFFKCFGCGEGGDAFKFIELVESVDFNEAVELLDARYKGALRAGTLLAKLHQKGPLQNLDDVKVLATIADVLYRTATRWKEEIENEAIKNSDLKAANEVRGINKRLSELIDSLDPFCESADQLLEWIKSLEKGES